MPDSRRLLVLAPQPFLEDRGTPLALKQILEALAELGVAADVVTYPVGRDPEIPGMHVARAANPLRIRSVPVGFSMRKLVLDAALWREARRFLASNDYHAIQASEEAAFLAVFLSRSSTEGRLPVIYDMQSSMPEQLAGRALFRLPLVRHWLDRCERWLIRHVDLVVASPGLAHHTAALAGETPVREWSFHALGSEAADRQNIETLRRELSIPENAPVVLYTGNFAAYQGLHLLLRAIPGVVATIPSVVFVLVGADVESKEAFREGEIPQKSIRIVPRRGRWDMHRYYALADALVSPRVTGMNLPLKIFDYLGAGKPLVATDIPAHRSILDERVAILVEPDPPALAEGICRVLLDTELRETLLGNTRAFALHQLGWGHFVESVRDIYRPILWPAE